MKVDWWARCLPGGEEGLLISKHCKLDDILDAAAKLLAQMTGYTAVIQDVEPTRQRLTGLRLFRQPRALAVLTLDESKPVTVQFYHTKEFLN